MQRFFETHPWALRVYIVCWLLVSPVHLLLLVLITGCVEVWKDVPSTYESAKRAFLTGKPD